ncbi:hypothetical protein BKA70DRAFT_1271726 [Coprinopsis sp. MPI-PUGE-AT-0042]|nr:hypothetical protein BKA70DRAFT_1271726 [Coprinopsis sp. MPI-PUGE-AT-0042]
MAGSSRAMVCIFIGGTVSQKLTNNSTCTMLPYSPRLASTRTRTVTLATHQIPMSERRDVVLIQTATSTLSKHQSVSTRPFLLLPAQYFEILSSPPLVPSLVRNAIVPCAPIIILHQFVAFSIVAYISFVAVYRSIVHWSFICNTVLV